MNRDLCFQKIGIILQMKARFAGLILLMSISYTTKSHASDAVYLRVGPHPGCGMFSVLSFVAGVLYQYEKSDYAGIEIDFEEYGLYYDKQYGPNSWAYYFEPICLGSKENAYIKNIPTSTYERYAYFNEGQLNREQVYKLIQKYFKIKQQIHDKIDRFVLENFGDMPTIGVHYRGTDKCTEAPRVGYDAVAKAVSEYITENHLQNYKIFVATDELQFIQFMQNAFKDSVIVYSTLHSPDGNPIHLKNSSPYLQGEEALIDCLLLAKSDVLIRTSSNLSRWSTYFNSLMPVIELNKRY